MVFTESFHENVKEEVCEGIVGHEAHGFVYFPVFDLAQ